MFMSAMVRIFHLSPKFLDLHNCSYLLTIRYWNGSCSSRSLMSSLECGAETKCLLHSMYIMSNVCYDMLGAFLRNNNMDYKRSAHNLSWLNYCSSREEKTRKFPLFKIPRNNLDLGEHVVFTRFYTFYIIIICWCIIIIFYVVCLKHYDELKSPYESVL